MENAHTINDLRQYQAMPLPVKIAMTQTRIRAWVNEYGTDGVYVSFSGGKDSTVLLHIVRGLYPDIPGVFVDTGLEFPEIRDFVRTFDNIIWLKPKMNFRAVLEKYGYPIISKDVAQCLNEIDTQSVRGGVINEKHGDGKRILTPIQIIAKGTPDIQRPSMIFWWMPLLNVPITVVTL